MADVLPRISVIILTYNRSSDDVVDCLRSVSLISYPDFEAILVDNSTKSPSAYSSLSPKDMRLLDVTGQKNLGAAGGRNVGIKHSTGKYFFFVDDDVILNENCLLELVRTAESDHSIGIIGPLMYRHDDPSKVWFYGSYIDQNRGETVVDVPLVVAGALLVKKEVIQKIGLFDENYFFYHEEWDLCYRAQKAGYRTVCSTKAYCWHKVPGDESGKLLVPKRAYYWHRNFFIFAGMHCKKVQSAFNFLLKNLIFYGDANFPCSYVVLALKELRFDALKSYTRGIIDGIAWYLRLRLNS